MPTTVNEGHVDQFGRQWWNWMATAGEGQKRGTTLEKSAAERKAASALRELVARESHDPEAVMAMEDEPRLGHTIMKAADGTVVEVPDATVEALLAAGYTVCADQDSLPQRTNEHAGPVEVAEEPKRRGPGRPPKEA
jgi:hypothetical protein